MKRKHVVFLLVCFSLSMLGLAFHHHADGLCHDHDCSICFHASLHSNLAFQDSPEIPPPVFAGLLIGPEQTDGPYGLSRSPRSNRAPPA